MVFHFNEFFWIIRYTRVVQLKKYLHLIFLSFLAYNKFRNDSNQIVKYLMRRDINKYTPVQEPISYLKSIQLSTWRNDFNFY